MSRRFWLAIVFAILLALASRGADDPYGDPIPEGAKARLGTARMRNVYAGPSTISPDGKYLVGQATGGGAAFYEPMSGKVVKSAKIESVFGTPIGFSADGKRVVSSSYESGIVWETGTGKVLATVKRAAPGGDNGFSLSADGKRLAVGGVRRDKEKGTSAVVWDVDANKLLATVTPVLNETAYVAISPDGKRLATWGYHFDRDAKEPSKPEDDPAKQVQFWDAATGKETGKVRAASGFNNPAAVVFNADSSLAAAASGDGTVYLFDPATGAAKGLLLGRSRQGRKLAFSPDGKTVAACGDDGSIQRWSAADGKRIGTTEAPFAIAYGPRGLVFADNDRVVAWGTRGMVAVVWEAPSGKLLTPAGGHTASVHSAAVAGGGAEIFTSGQDGQILRWNPTTGKELGPIALKIPGATGFPLTSTATLSPDGTRALANESSGIAVYDLPSGSQAFVIPGDHVRESRGAFTSDSTKVVQVLTSFDIKKNPARVAVWDVVAAKKLGEVELPGISYPNAVLAPDGKTLIVAGVRQDDKNGNANFVVTGWELAGGKKLGEYSEAGGFGSGFVAATGDSKTAVVTTPKGTAVVIDVTTGKKLRDLEVGRGGQAAAAPVVSPDGKTAAILIGGGFGPTANGRVELVDIESGKTKKTLTGVTGNPSVAVFSTDGKTLITGSHDTTALVWDLSK